MPGVQIIGGDTIRTPMVGQAHGKVAAIFATSPILDAPEFGHSGVGFTQRFKQRFGHAPVYGAHYAYDAVQLVADALRRNQSVEKARLLDRLKTFEGIAPVTGFMRFDASGEQRYGVIGLYRLQRDGWELMSRSDQW
jgi:branched-chain amino acid transport system substrate-binding protein